MELLEPVFRAYYGLLIASWCLFLVWSIVATVSAYPQLGSKRRLLVLLAWVSIAAGGALDVLGITRAAYPLVGIGAAGLGYALIGWYPAMPTKLHLPAFLAFCTFALGASIYLDSFTLVLGPLSGPALYFALFGWLILLTLSSIPKVSAIHKAIYASTWLLMLINFARQYPNQDYWLEPLMIVLVLFLPREKLMVSDEAARVMRYGSFALSAFFVIGSLFGAAWAVQNDVFWAIAPSTLGVAAGLAGLSGAYFQNRYLLIGAGFFFLLFFLGLFQIAVALGPILLPLAIAILIHGLTLPAGPSRDSRVVEAVG